MTMELYKRDMIIQLLRRTLAEQQEFQLQNMKNVDADVRENEFLGIIKRDYKKHHEFLLQQKRNQEKQEMVLEKPEIETEELQTNQPSPIPQEQSPQTVTRDEPKYGRNEIVKITNGQDTKELKYKKAMPLIESGEWKIV